MSDHEEIAQMIEDCAERDEKLTDWERSFIDSIGHQVIAGGSLSEKQDEQLTKIWERVT